MDFTKSRKLQKKSHNLIPAGCHTYAKGDDQYPVLAPGFIVKGQGCHVWDVDGNKYIEYGMGCRAVALGHAYPEVVNAARAEMLNGSNFTRPSTLEVDCAEKMLNLLPAADMVKFTKNGSDATTAAVKLARAYTGRNLVALCADHPFFSTDDWFIGTTPVDAGIPTAVKKLTRTFKYNDIESVRLLFQNHPNQIAALILEPVKYDAPKDSFLHQVRELCHANGALFILDEMIAGFRMHIGGGQVLYEVEPDLSTFGKALGNGFAVSALAGKKEIMQLGGLFHAEERVFLLSTTHGAETHALAAAMAVIRTYEQQPVIERLYSIGQRLADGLNQVIETQGLQEYVQIHGFPCNLVFATRDQDKKPSQSFRSLFMQEMIKRGVLGPSFVVSYSHTAEDIDRTVEAFDASLKVYRDALELGAEQYLVGRPTQVVYRRYNSPAQSQTTVSNGVHGQ